MQRRNFLRTALAAPAAHLSSVTPSLAALGFGALAGAAHAANTTQPFSAAAFSLAVAGDAALRPLLGWDGQDRATAELRIEGRWPRGLSGTLYRNGPGLMQRGDARYRHWFDGDGLVHAWRFADGRASHQARFVRTAKFEAEQRAGRFLLPAFGTAIEAERMVSNADSLNVANTSVLPIGDAVHALWEGGSAYELDARTLATRGPKTWAPGLQGMPFSAHPKVQPDGRIWNFGTSGKHLAVYEISPRGTLTRQRALTLDLPPLVHDFAVSEHYLVFLLAPIGLDYDALHGGESLAGAMRWRAGDATRVLVLDKATLTPRWYELPAALVFHFGNAWDSADEIVLDYVEQAPLPVFNAHMDAMMSGRSLDHMPSSPRLLRLPLKPGVGTTQLVRRDESVEFPVVDPRVVGQRHRFVYYPTRLGDAGRWGFDGVMRLDLETGERQRSAFDGEVLIEEQLLVPRPGSTREGEGWLVGTGYDVRRQRSFVSVFDAEHLADGLVARAWAPYWVPLGFHGRFVAA